MNNPEIIRIKFDMFSLHHPVEEGDSVSLPAIQELRKGTLAIMIPTDSI